MRLSLRYLASATIVALGLASCSAAAGEPSEAQMKEAMEYAINHPPGITVTEPGKITFFKKEASDEPTKQGYNCTFEVQVTSTNSGMSMYNNIPKGVFYKDDSGKWQMRPPF